ncbi:acyl carrier protein, partial [Salmonella enterica]|nr:acyl carrier protein [Salmonella enterica]
DDLLIEQLELDSLDLVELVVMAKRKFGVTIIAEDFKDCVTVGHLCDIISKKKV